MVQLVACGPESSGTHLLYYVLTEYVGVEATHRSLPNAGEWWEQQPDERYVVVVRRPDVTCLSILGRHPALVEHIQQARDHWSRAMGILSGLSPAYWITYEALILNGKQQADNIAAWLGVTPSGTMPAIFDANRKWLSALWSG